MMTKSPQCLVFQTVAPVMTTSARQSCVAGWQNFSVGWLKNLSFQHKLLPTLEYCLQHHQMWDEVPRDIQAVIQQSRQFHGLRQLKVVAQLAEMDAALSRIGAEVVLLKGAALLHYAVYPDLGSRVNADIDILVAPDRVSSVVAVFRQLGYTFQGNYDPNHHYHHHLPPLVRSNSLHVEIHPLQSGTGSPIHQRMLDTAEEIEGFSALRLPIVTELFWHMALHARSSLPQLRNLLDLHRLRSLYVVDGVLLADRARVEGLEAKWSVLMSELAEFELGKMSTQTIQTWTWRPSTQFDGAYAMWRTYGWGSFVQPVSRFTNRSIGAILFLPAILWRSFRFIGLFSEYCWSRLEFGIGDLTAKAKIT